MKTKDRPFEGVLGNTVELRTIERLLASPRAEFNVSDLARMTGVSRGSSTLVIRTFLEFGIIEAAGMRAGVEYFRLREDDPLTLSVIAFNDMLLQKTHPDVSGILDEIEGEGDKVGQAVRSQSNAFHSTTVDATAKPSQRQTAREDGSEVRVGRNDRRSADGFNIDSK